MSNDQEFVTSKQREPEEEKKQKLGIGFHVAFGFLAGVLLALIQVKYQSLSLSPFDTNPMAVSFFVVASSAYSLSLAVVLIAGDDKFYPLLTHICLILGPLSCFLLLLILSPVISWLFLILYCFIYFGILTSSYEQVLNSFQHLPQFVLEPARNWFKWGSGWFHNMIFRSNAGELVTTTGEEDEGCDTVASIV